MTDPAGNGGTASNTGSMQRLTVLRFVVPILLALLVALKPNEGDLLPAFERQIGSADLHPDIDNEYYSRSTIRFSSRDSNGTMMEAWQYLPKHKENMPIVLMAHGLGAQRDFGLHKTADYFARQGAAVIIFDYRTFGGSDGEPRHWASPFRQLDDWRAAIAYATDPAAGHLWNTSNLVLWGTSYSGGHVLVLGSELKNRVSGIISQVPYLSGSAASAASLKTRGLLPSIRLALTGLLDAIGHKFGWSPIYVRLAGLHNTMSVMALSQAELTAWSAKHPKVKLGGWQPQILARIATESPSYSPILHLRNITRPVMLISAEQDSLCPHKAVQQAADILGVQLLSYPVDHFSLYLDGVWADAVDKQWKFICNVTHIDCSTSVPDSTVA